MAMVFASAIKVAAILALMCLAKITPAVETPAAPIQWIDVHVHPIGGRRLPDYQGAVDAALAAMRESGIRHMVMMPPPQAHAGAFDYADFARAIKPHAARLSFLGGGGTLNVMLQQAADQQPVSESTVQRFEEKAAEILAAGGCLRTTGRSKPAENQSALSRAARTGAWQDRAREREAHLPHPAVRHLTLPGHREERCDVTISGIPGIASSPRFSQ